MLSAALFFTSIGGVKIMRDEMGKRKNNKESNRINSVNTQLEIVNQILAKSEAGINEISQQDIVRFRNALEIIENTENHITSLSSENRVSRICREKYQELINAKFSSIHREMRDKLKALKPDSSSDNSLASFDERLQELNNLATDELTRNALEELTHLVNTYKKYFKNLFELESLLFKLERKNDSVINDINTSFNSLRILSQELSSEEFNNHFSTLRWRYQDAMKRFNIFGSYANVEYEEIQSDLNQEISKQDHDLSESEEANEDYTPLNLSQFTYPESPINQGRSYESLNDLIPQEQQQNIIEDVANFESDDEDQLIEYAKYLISHNEETSDTGNDINLNQFEFEEAPAELIHENNNIPNQTEDNIITDSQNHEETYEDGFMLVEDNNQYPTLEIPNFNEGSSLFSLGFIGTLK